MILCPHIQHSFRVSTILTVFLTLVLSGCAPRTSSDASSQKIAVEKSLSEYFYVDPKNILPDEIRKEALIFYAAHRNEVSNPRDFTVIILPADSEEKMSYHVDMQTGEVEIQRDETIFLASDDTLIYTAGSVLEENTQMARQKMNSSQADPLWETAKPNAGSDWTQFTLQTLQTDGSHLLAGSKDMADFCPNYDQTSSSQKSKFWAFLISAMAQYESGFQPTLRFRESSMGKDPITGQHVYSEGLLQLSYQDQGAYPFCNEFNWKADRHLSEKDPQRTIFDPHKNLRCGIRILNQLVGNNGRISFSGHYWATLKPRSSAKRAIQSMTNKIGFCQR